MRAAAVFLAILAGLLAAGCSAVQESLECPGTDCPPALKAVADGSASVPQVTSVDRAWRFYNIDKGHSGGVEVHANVADEQAAQAVASRIAGIYRDSEVEAVSRISVRVIPDPEVAEPGTEEGTLVSGPSQSADVTCAAKQCADEVAGFVQDFAGDPLSAGATLGKVAWVADDYRPYTSIDITASDEALTPDDLADFRSDVLRLARASGLTELGQVKTVIHYQKRVAFDFSFDGNQDAG